MGSGSRLGGVPLKYGTRRVVQKEERLVTLEKNGLATVIILKTLEGPRARVGGRMKQRRPSKILRLVRQPEV